MVAISNSAITQNVKLRAALKNFPFIMGKVAGNASHTEPLSHDIFLAKVADRDRVALKYSLT